MLNELFDAASSLDKAGIATTRWHDVYTPVPRLRPVQGKKTVGKPTFFVFLGKTGGISRIERCASPDEIAGLRKWESGNGYSFPYFNIPPLLWIDFDPSKQDKTFKQALENGTLTIDALHSFISGKKVAAKMWDTKHFKRVGDCIGKIAVDLASMLGKPPNEYEAIAILIKRAQEFSAKTFYEQLVNAFNEAMLANPSFARLYFDAAYHYGKKEPSNNISILLELEDWVFYPVKHPKVSAWINEKLLGQQAARTKARSQQDAFGNDLAGCEGKLPDVNVGVLGSVTLRAMNHESACQYRYGKIDEHSFPVGRQSRDAMKSALAWLTDPERKGKTWDTVSRATENKEILLAYPSEIPADPPELSLMFGTDPTRVADSTSAFEDCAKNVTGTLRGLMAMRSDLDLRVFVLRKMDKARTRVTVSRRYSAQHLIEAARYWRQASRNLPPIRIKQFSKDGKTELRDAQVPFPMDVIWVLNTLWSRDGKTPSRVKTFSAHDGISLLLEEGSIFEPVLQRAMYAATRNAAGLLVAIGQEQHGKGNVFEVEKKYAKTYRRQQLILPCIFGLLLSKMRINKEHYMTSPPFLVGRLLSLADQLHYHYCVHVRNKPETRKEKLSIPPQLMGNALMPTALEQPIKALALYAQRILPYQAWARTASGDGAGLARYFLSELGNVCSEVAAANIPERCDDADKAQMLIGYLARSEKADSETTRETTHEQ